MEIRFVTCLILSSVISLSCASQPANSNRSNQNNNRNEQFEILASHFQYVISPTVRGNSVVLTSEKYIIIYRPKNIFTIINIQTEEAVAMGYYEYTIFSQPRIPNELFGKIFLFNYDDIANITSRQELLSSNFADIAHTILVPVKSTDAEVVYRYEKPIEIFGTEMVYRIAVILEN